MLTRRAGRSGRGGRLTGFFVRISNLLSQLLSQNSHPASVLTSKRRLRGAHFTFSSHSRLSDPDVWSSSCRIGTRESVLPDARDQFKRVQSTRPGLRPAEASALFPLTGANSSPFFLSSLLPPHPARQTSAPLPRLHLLHRLPCAPLPPPPSQGSAKRLFKSTPHRQPERTRPLLRLPYPPPPHPSQPSPSDSTSSPPTLRLHPSRPRTQPPLVPAGTSPLPPPEHLSPTSLLLPRVARLPPSALLRNSPSRPVEHSATLAIRRTMSTTLSWERLSYRRGGSPGIWTIGRVRWSRRANWRR